MAKNKYSTAKKHYAVVVGARPNFIKAAAFFRRAKEYPDLKFTLIHTGQHFDKNMSKIFFEQMRIPKPDIDLRIRGKLHTEKIGKMFNSLKKIFEKKKFNGVIVFGDVNSTLAGALAASKGGMKIVHIESGLRSHDRRMPEEINRVIVDHLSDILFTSEPSAQKNLLKEGIDKKKINYVGNIMINSLEIFEDYIDKSDILNKLNLNEKSYFVATIHRQENTDDKDILIAILKLLQEVSELKQVIIPLHPGTKNKIINYGINDLLKNLIIIDPLGYFDFLKLVKSSSGVLTDSGGIQEETSHLGIPCATLRNNTERPITLTKGSNKLFSFNEMYSDPKGTVKAIVSHLTNNKFLAKRIPKWDNKVAERILNCL